jgi:hypothetical protein
MLKKLESPSAPQSFRHTFAAFCFALLCAAPFYGVAQDGEMKQKISAFKSDQNDKYDMKYLNIADRNLGSIDDTDPAWKDQFLLKAKERQKDNIGNNSYFKFYFSIYGYEDIDDRQYALKDWMENFIEGRSIRAGRDVRTYEYAKPTIILINDKEIIICNFDCSDYTEDIFKDWKKQLLTFFGQDNTIVIELMCDGPLEWTKNAPDPKSKQKMF